MKKVIFAVLFSGIVFSASAQKKSKDNTPFQAPSAEPAATEYPIPGGAATGVTQDRLVVLKSIYQQSLKYGDLQVAKNAVYEMLAADPSQTNLKDSLAYLYFNMNAMGECLLVSRDILSSNPSKSTILELKAVAEQNLGLYKDALGDYEKLFSATREINFLYQIAVLQYELKRLGECKLSVEQIINDSENNKKEISISFGNRQSQKVPMKAAALNLKGVLAMEINEFDAARKLFEEAVAVFPSFVLAKGNLEYLSKKNSGAKSSSSSGTAPKKSAK